MRTPFWFVSVEADKACCPFVSVEADKTCCPAMVMYQADHSFKGVALFSSELSAEAFIFKLHESGMTLRASPTLLSGDTVRAFAGNLMRYASPEKVLKELPVYLDPPDTYCKDASIRPLFSNLERFFLRYMQSEVPWQYRTAAILQREKFTLIILQSEAAEDQYVGQAIRGHFLTREEISIASEDVIGTSEEKTSYYRTPLCAQAADAVRLCESFAEKNSL